MSLRPFAAAVLAAAHLAAAAQQPVEVPSLDRAEG